MRVIPIILVSFVLCAPALARDGDQREAQVAAATANALDTLESKLLSASITPDLSVREFIDRTDSHAILDDVVGRAEQIGGARWLDEKTCQVRMELPGSEIADALVHIADTKPREAKMPAQVLQRRLERMRDATFSATGVSTSAAEKLRPPPEQIAWRGVDDTVVQAAVIDARRNAASQVLNRVQILEVPPGGARLCNVLSDAKVRNSLEGYLMQCPVTSVVFQDGMEVRVAVAVNGPALWDQLTGAVGDRKDLPFPKDAESRAELGREFLKRIEQPVGRAIARPAGPALQRAEAAVIPLERPRWVVEQVDARGSSRAVDSPLKTARAAETAARDRLKSRLEGLPLTGKQTLGDAAQNDRRVRTAIDRAVDKVRPRTVNYLSDGSAEVTFSLDLRDLWNEIESDDR
jgi:hypothetical protein